MTGKENCIKLHSLLLKVFCCWNDFQFVVPDLHTKHLHFGSYMYDEFGRNLKLDFALRALSCFLRKSVMQSVKVSKPKKNICRSILLRDCMGFAWKYFWILPFDPSSPFCCTKAQLWTDSLQLGPKEFAFQLLFGFIIILGTFEVLKCFDWDRMGD